MSAKSTNNLFPVFLKLEHLAVLIVGGGAVALEKLSAILDNSPGARVHLVAKSVSEKIRERCAGTAVVLSERAYEDADLDSADLVFVAIDDYEESARICAACKSAGKLVNAADKPGLCDFYLGSVVRKGNLKLAISTNGLSPTLAKRLRLYFEDILPDEVDELLEHLQQIRAELKGDFASKVSYMNGLTETLIPKNNTL